MTTRIDGDNEELQQQQTDVKMAETDRKRLKFEAKVRDKNPTTVHKISSDQRNEKSRNWRKKSIRSQEK
jgi:hypothetical protein